MDKIAIFGGSFDPPHAGHDAIIRTALSDLDIDKMIILPTFCSPFKLKFSAPTNLRLKWAKTLWGNLSKVEVSDFEILRGLKNGQKIPTITSVRHFKELLNPEKIYLIIGADCLENLHLWHEFFTLKELVEFVVASRENFLIKDDFKALKKLEINVKISSSLIRQKLDFKEIPPEIRQEVSEFYEKQN